MELLISSDFQAFLFNRLLSCEFYKGSHTEALIREASENDGLALIELRKMIKLWIKNSDTIHFSFHFTQQANGYQFNDQ